MHAPRGKKNLQHSFASARTLLLALFAVSCGSAQEVEEQTIQGNQAVAANPRGEVTTHIVEISSFKFVPDVLKIKKGDRVVWKNLDIVPHTTTADLGFWLDH